MSLRENITELRALLREIEPLPPAAPSAPPQAANDPAGRLQRAYEWWDLNQSGPVLDTSPRAVALRRIRVLCAWRTWGETVVMRELDRLRASRLDDLSDDQVGGVLDRLEAYESAAQCGCDPDDDLPAR